MRGVFVTFEGCDGSGKSTQISRVSKLLREAGLDVLLTREPGGTPFGERVREVLLGRESPERTALAELLLYAASRAHLVSQVILPALVAGKIVISERFADSSWVYQGYAGGVPVADVETINKIATAGLEPDLTLVLDVPDAAFASRRMTLRQKDKIEARDSAYHARVIEGYRVLSRRFPARVRMLDGSLPESQVTEDILTHIVPLLRERGYELAIKLRE